MKLNQLSESKFKLSKKTGLMLKHGPSQSYRLEHSAADGIETLEGLFPEELDGSLIISGCKDLVSLKGAPKIVHGNLHVSDNPKLHSLEHGPQTVDKIFVCSAHSFNTFEHMPRRMSEFICNQSGSPTPITSLHNLHKMVDEISWRIGVMGIKSHILSVLLIPGGLNYFQVGNLAVELIMEKYLKQVRQGGHRMNTVLECQEELIAAGLDEFAKL